MSYFQATYSTLVTRDGYVLSVPNGTSVAGLGLTASLTGGTGSQGVLGLQEVYPAIPGLVMSEWQEGNLVSLPIDLTPTSGTLVNDTMYTLRFASLISTQSTQIVDYMLILMVGDPYDADLTVTPTQNSQPVTAPIDVTVGSSIIALGLSVAAQNASGQGIGLATTVSNTGTTGIDPSQFSGFGSAGLTAPNGTASGVFDTEGTLTVRMYGWGINQYASGSAWAIRPSSRHARTTRSAAPSTNSSTSTRVPIVAGRWLNSLKGSPRIRACACSAMLSATSGAAPSWVSASRTRSRSSSRSVPTLSRYPSLVVSMMASPYALRSRAT